MIYGLHRLGFKLSNRPVFKYKARGGPYSYVNDSNMERSVERPINISGDFLDNRRIFSKLDEYMDFSGRSGTNTNSKEFVMSMFISGSQSFFAPEVADLLNESDYSFPTMFTYLAKKAQEETPKFFRSSPDHSEFDKFLSGGPCQYKTTSYFIDMLSFIYEWVRLERLEIIYYWNMWEYASEYNSENPVFDVRISPFNRLSVLVNNWNNYKTVNETKTKESKIIDFIKIRFRSKKYSSKYELLDTQIKEIKEMFVGPYDQSLDTYMRQLSSCMLLPDDDSAEPEDLHLIDTWLEMFDAFYPKYEELLAWYKSEHG